MARIESQAVAGYFPTPSHLLPAIASLAAFHVEDKRISFMDPCAGKGEAICTLVDFLVPQDRRNHVKLFTCEMEETRHAELSRRCAFGERDKALHGDAFRVTFSKGSYDGISLLYLNPPYDLDRVHGRLEQKFLARFAPALMTGGVLIFLVPFHALKASAAFLATEFTDIRCFRFPTADFEAYKQVVLVAKKREALQGPDPKVERKVLAWADDADRIPVLPELDAMPKPLMVTPSREYYGGLEKWDMRPVDITGLMSKVAPWHYTQRSGGLARLPHVLPDVPLQDLMLRQYPVATPPRPAHIASGIASGIFNGSRIESEKAGLPSLLVKGVFDKEYKTVEEKTNKDGEVIGLLQVQAPKLVTTVLDLSKRTYHTLVAGTTGSSEVAKMGVGDLLQHYGASLMQVMETQCPILYDPRRPEDVFPLPSSPRTLFTAQGHATRAVVKLLGGPTVSPRARRHRAAILLGEIGSGKTTVALMSAKTIASRRMLVMCPPHLLQSWTDEVASVRPDAEVRVLQSVTDIDDLAAYKSDRPVVAILSRETAKLGHGWQAVPDLCPACGQKVPAGVDLAKTRAQCEATQWVPTCKFSRWGVALSRKAAFAAPGDFHLSHLRTRIETAHREALVVAKKHVPFTGLSDAFLDEMLDACVARRVEESSESLSQAIVWLCALGPTVERISRVGQALMASTSSWNVTDTVRALLHLLPARSKEQGDVKTLLQAQRPASYSYGGSPFASFDGEIKSLIESNGTARFLEMTIKYEKGKPVIDDKPISALRSLRLAAIGLQKSGTFKKTPPCGERLYQAIPEPRRYALANYISKRHANLFDLLVLDEGHEYATDGSAQERSAHRLTSLGLPVILMTGTIMNGYAESLFTNMWALSPAFRVEFERKERSKFVDRYGYRKRLLQDRDADGKVVEFGSHTDRVEQTERVVGDSPGVLPLFLLRHLLPIAVTLHKADLAIDLPKCEQAQHQVATDDELFRRYRTLRDALVTQIKKDQFTERAGCLMGALAELPSFLDRATADVGNVDDGRYVVRYPDSVGGEVVAAMEPLDPSVILPKEAFMLDQIEAEIAAGRNVLVFAWHVNLLPRIARIISERIGETVPILHADKVSPAKRQEWINKEVVRKKRHVLVTNPVAIQTGLNNLVHFATEIWHENPACNPVIFRQAVGRIDRIGQKLETRVLVPVYENTLQIALYDLLMRKVAVSVSTDGLDPESALRAAGVGEDEYITGLSIGKQLWSMIGEGHYSAAA